VVNFMVGITYFYFFYPFKAVGLTPKTNLILVAAISPFLPFGWRRVVLGLFRMSQLRQRVAFLGEDPHIREIKHDLRKHAHLGYVPVPCRVPAVDLVVADGRWVDEHWERVQGTMARIVRHRVPVLSLQTFYEGLFGKVMVAHAASASWLFGSVLTHARHWYQPVKRLFDLAVGAALLLLAAPLLAIIALLCGMLQGRPVFFGQPRTGRGGRAFKMWKFRTMRVSTAAHAAFDGGVAARRVTRLGTFLRRWRLDELPQLWNVLRGEMSLVGPRPEWTKEVDVLRKRIPHYDLRHFVRPGMTGWAQLNFRATSDPTSSLEKFRYDLYYIQNISLNLDLTILLRTARRLFQRDAGFAPGRQRLMYFAERDVALAANLGSLLSRSRG